MVLYTLGGQMLVRFKWNSKYFDDKTFRDIDAKAAEYLGDFVSSEYPDVSVASLHVSCVSTRSRYYQMQ